MKREFNFARSSGVAVGFILVILLSGAVIGAADSQYEGRYSADEPPEPHNHDKFLVEHSDVESASSLDELVTEAVTQYYGLWSAISPETLEHYVTLLENDTTDADDDVSLSMAEKNILAVGGGYVNTYDEYPAFAQVWNEYTLQAYTAGDADVSRYPYNTNIDSSKYVKAAYVDTVSIDPSVHFHADDSPPTRLVGDSGDIHFTADYRVDVPDDTSTGSSVGDKRYEYTLQSHKIVKTELIISRRGTVDADSSGSHTGTLTYSGMDDGTTEFTVRTTIEARVNEHVEQKRRTCVSRNATTGECESWSTYWSTTRDEDVTDRVTVKDITTVAHDPIEANKYSGTFRNHPDGYSIIRLETGDKWLTAEFPDGQYLTSPYRMFGHRDKGWDHITSDTATDSTTTISDVHPVELHVAPWVGGVERVLGTGPNKIRFDVEVDDGETISAPSQSRFPAELQSRFNFNLVEESYEHPTRFTIKSRYGKVLNEGDSVTYHSVTGKTAEIDMEKSGDIKETRLNVTTLNESRDDGGNVTIQVRLVEKETGNPIRTTNRGGNITVNGRIINTGSDGTAQLTFEPEGRIIQGTFHPDGSWDYETVFVKDSDTVVLPVRTSGVIKVLNAWMPVGVIFGSVYVLLKMISTAIRPGKSG